MVTDDGTPYDLGEWQDRRITVAVDPIPAVQIEPTGLYVLALTGPLLLTALGAAIVAAVQWVPVRPAVILAVLCVALVVVLLWRIPRLRLRMHGPQVIKDRLIGGAQRCDLTWLERAGLRPDHPAHVGTDPHKMWYRIRRRYPAVMLQDVHGQSVTISTWPVWGSSTALWHRVLAGVNSAPRLGATRNFHANLEYLAGMAPGTDDETGAGPGAVERARGG